MKRKYSGLIAIVIMGAVLLPAAIYTVYSSQIPGGFDRTRLTGLTPEFAVPDTALTKRLSSLEKEMVVMANPGKSESVINHNIRFWRYSDQNYRGYTMNNKAQEKIDAKASYALTFTFAAREKRFCIIDGSFYTQGAELPGGGKIVKIESGRVRVKKEESAEWISLSETAKWGEIQ